MPDHHSPDPANHLHETSYLTTKAPEVIEILDQIRVGALSQTERAIALFSFVRDQITFEFLPKQHQYMYKATHILEVGRGFCVQKATLLTTLGRAAGIPTALVFTDLRDQSLSPLAQQVIGTDILTYHGLAAFFLDGRWVKVDPTFSPEITKKKRYLPVEFDGTLDALIHPTTATGSPHAEYLRWHGYFQDLPFEAMIAAFTRTYPAGAFEHLLSLRRPTEFGSSSQY